MGPDAGDDGRFMALALALGRRGLGRTWPNPAVGAVIVNGGIIVGRGWTQPGGRPHAEVEALRRAGEAARGATLYVTLEPCSHHGKSPPCADAIVAAGVAGVVSALGDPNPKVSGQGYARLRAAGITVVTGVGADEARRDHAGHIRRVCDGRPNVTLKLAVSADGKVGAAGRKPLAITGAETRARVHLLRAQNDAIMVGIGTVLADDPLLTCRLPGMEKNSPVRIVLDRALRLPPSSRLAQTARQTPVWAVCGADAPQVAEQALLAQGVDIFRIEAAVQSEQNAGRLDLAVVLKLIAGRGITRLMVEGGPTVAASFVAADLVDEAMVFRSPKTVGADGIDALEGLPLSELTQSPRLRALAALPMGGDICDVYGRR
ncbi:MAG: bifunctional diaminohydroxyphosphoribosylaminopyrimidine deaminase/5-amino-6-(5-phosphoribosylamino)uracil reductase RibD [Hyphomicrobiales bacterium]|nr:bifunctional diaminohydroxyphosphoribosylaminopyrimidine deaminase/5-amino-6-(5-phosphoribosylamino)uracil reductase RibD [Hyphomicrobiales bacterium]